MIKYSESAVKTIIWRGKKRYGDIRYACKICLHWLDFSGPGLTRTKDKDFLSAQKISDNFGLRLEQNTKSWPGLCPTT